MAAAAAVVAVAVAERQLAVVAAAAAVQLPQPVDNAVPPQRLLPLQLRFLLSHPLRPATHPMRMPMLTLPLQALLVEAVRAAVRLREDSAADAVARLLPLQAARLQLLVRR